MNRPTLASHGKWAFLLILLASLAAALSSLVHRNFQAVILSVVVGVQAVWLWNLSWQLDVRKWFASLDNDLPFNVLDTREGL